MNLKFINLMKRKIKKNYKRLSRFDKSLIMGLIIDTIKKNKALKRSEIHQYVEKNDDYKDLVKNLGFVGSELLKKQYESLIDNNLGKLIKRGIVEINIDKNYTLSSHGDEMWVKYNKDWYLLARLNNGI